MERQTFLMVNYQHESGEHAFRTIHFNTYAMANKFENNNLWLQTIKHRTCRSIVNGNEFTQKRMSTRTRYPIDLNSTATPLTRFNGFRILHRRS